MPNSIGKYGHRKRTRFANEGERPGSLEMTMVIVAGLLLALSACSTPVIDILCPPAGQCPNTVGGHTVPG
jgi:hypothetical protein